MYAQAAPDLEPQAAPGTTSEEDPLLEALLVVARLLGRTTTRNAARAGLPLDGDRFSPEHFQRTAERIGLSCRLVQRKLDAISDLLTPCVLLLGDDQVCVLLESPKGREQVRVVWPATGDGESSVDVARLQAEYSGYAFLLKERHQFDERTPELSGATRGHWFWSTLGSSWRIYRDVLFASLLINLFALASPLFIMNVYDRVVPNKAFDTLWVLASGVLVVILFDFLLRMLRGYFLDLAGRKSDILLSSKIFAQVMGLRMSAQPASVGSFANNLREFESIRDFITSATVTALVDLPFVVIFLLAIFFLSGPVAWVPAIGIGIILLYGIGIQPAMRRSVEQGFRSAAQKNGLLVEALNATDTVKTLGAEGRMQKQWEAQVAQIAQWGAHSRLLSSSAGNVASLVTQLSSVAVVIAGVYLIQDHSLSMGGLIAAVILSGRALAPMAQVANLSTRYFQARSALQSLGDIMQQEVERPQDKRFLSRDRLQGSVEFEHVHFSYPGEEQPSLQDVSLRIEPGERVAIIGRIGSGKSTLLRLLIGLYQPQQGAIRMDGVDLKQLDPADLRRNIGYASQEATLFYGSVRDNLVFGAPHVEDQRVLAVARAAGVTRFVNHHPHGFDMQVGEKGARLSGGQRQSVALGRSLLLDPPILMLDEPTGAMDNRTEEEIKKSLLQEVKNRTLLLVTHRASLLALVDRVIVMDEGRVLADGPKENVLEALRQGRIKTSDNRNPHA